MSVVISGNVASSPRIIAAPDTPDAMADEGFAPPPWADNTARLFNFGNGLDRGNRN
jgi:hypothetical protein